MADVKWIKITTNVFDDEKMKLIDVLPERDAIIVIWFKLLTLAGKINDNGKVYIMEQLATTDEVLATVFNRPITVVRLALQTFVKFRMIEMNEHINIVNWEKHQNIEGLEKIREQNRLRKQKQRELENIKKLENTKEKEVVTGQSRDVTQQNKNRIDKNRIDKNRIEEEKSNNNLSCKQDDVPYKEIINYLNNKIDSNYKHTTNKTKELIRARFEEGFKFDDFKIVIDKKSETWKNTDMQKYLRPQTLFGTKFESYLNEKISLSETGKISKKAERTLKNAIKFLEEDDFIDAE